MHPVQHCWTEMKVYAQLVLFCRYTFESVNKWEYEVVIHMYTTILIINDILL